MGKKSRTKGVRGEAELVKILERATPGLPCKRTGFMQNSGNNTRNIAPDVQHPLFSAEAKRYKKIGMHQVTEGYLQACATSKPDQMPIVYHRSDGSDGMITMSASDWSELVKEWWELKNK